jgi:hypothetical protein
MRIAFFLLLIITGFDLKCQVTFTDSDIPIVLIDTYSNTIVGNPKVQSHIKIIYNGPGNRNHVTDLPAYEGEMGIELHGTYSLTFPQQSYGFELRDTLSNNLDTTLLGMPKEHDWLLITNYNDKAFSRNTLASNLFTQMGNYAPRSKFCEVVINNDYKGIYLLSESIKRDKHRVDIAKLDSTEITYPNVSGGYIFKNDYWNSSSETWQSSFTPPDHPGFTVNLVYSYPKPQNIQPAQKTYLQTSVNQFETALYATNFTDPINGYRKYADELSFIDFFIIQELSRNYDGFMHSVYFHKDIDNVNISKIKCGPVWDFDWAFNNINVSNCTDFAAADGSGWSYKINDCNVHSVNSTEWHVRMLQDTDYINLQRCRWERLRKTILDTVYLFKHIDSVATYLNESQARHYTRWGHISVNVGNCHAGPIPSTFVGHVQQLKDWLKIRAAWLDGNLPGNSANCVLGIDELSNAISATIYPNPANTQFTLSFSKSLFNASIEVRSADGSLVANKVKFNGQTLTVNTSEYSNGIYFVRTNSGTATSVFKMVVIH